ncbi:MAG: (d)CMP kinase [Rhodospirillaceae bacterium]|nr:(d)CMP kinase [Rhodospirillaceae bacterium]
MTKTVAIALDGPAASGKGTLARRLAKDLGLRYLDTGSLYRAVGVATLQAGGDPADPVAATKAAEALDIEKYSPADLRAEAAGNAASKVAAIPGVRAALLDYQRRFAAQAPGAVLDGRDVGTVVLPKADVKIFVKADFEVRLQRRVAELRLGGQTIIESRVREDMAARDARDSNRSVAPLVPAEDAWILDTSVLNADQAFDAAKAYIVSKLKA